MDRPLGFAWDAREIVRAPRRALDPSSALLGAVGCILVLAILAACTYVGILVDGRLPVGYVWSRLGLFPWLYDFRLSAGGSFARSAGAVMALGVMIYALVAMAKVAYRRLKGDDSFAFREATRHAMRRGHAVVTALSLLAAGALGLILAGLVISYAARLPGVGEIILAVALIPGVGASLAVILLMVAAMGTAVLGPAAVGTLDDDWLDTLIHVGAIMWGQTGRWVVYELLAAGMTLFGGCLAAAILVGALTMALGLLGVFVPGTIIGTVLVASRQVPGLHWGLFWFAPEAFPPLALTPGMYVAGATLTLAVVLVAALAAGYTLSVWATAQTLIYVLLRKRHLGQNILERQDDIDRLRSLAARAEADVLLEIESKRKERA